MEAFVVVVVVVILLIHHEPYDFIILGCIRFEQGRTEDNLRPSWGGRWPKPAPADSTNKSIFK